MPERLAEAPCRDCVHNPAVPSGIPGWLAACALMAAGAVALPETSRADPYAPKWHPWVEFGGLGATDDDNRGVVELWSPILQGPTALFFFDGRFQFIADDAQEGNAQFGLRKMTPSGWNLGAWGSFDVRETSLDNTFWQVAGGLEALSVKWDLRLNGYLPVTDPQASPSTAEVRLKRNNIFMIGGEEVSLHGFDGEIGYMLFGSPETKPGTRHELRVYGGGFWFDDEDAIGEVAGPSARLEWRIDDLVPKWGGSRLTFDAGWSHDDVRGDLWQAGARLRLPFGTKNDYAALSPQARRMQERIERDDDIVVVESGPEQVFDTLTGVRFDRVAHVNPSITEVSAEAGDNSLLIVNGTVSGPQELQGNQTLMGGKSTIHVTGLKSGVTKSFTAPGATAHLMDPGLDPNLTLLGSNTHVAGLDIHGTPTVFPVFGNAAGISVPGPFDNVVIEQTSIADTGFFGISLGGDNTDVRIFDTTITNGGTIAGIFLGIDNSDVEISRVTISDTEGSGIFLGVDSRHVNIADTTITGIETSGIVIGTNASDVKISNVALSDISGIGILASSNNSNITIANSRLTDIAATGIRFLDGNSNVTIEDTIIDGVGGDGIEFGDLNSNVTIVNTIIADTGDNGILFNDNNTNVAIADTAIIGVGAQGIFFFDDNENVTISGTTITDTGGNGIFFVNNNSNVSVTGTSITNAGGDGIRFNDDNSNVTIAHTTITDAGSAGIRIRDANSNLMISGVDVARTGADGIIFGISNGNATISDTTITDAGDDGLHFGISNSVNVSNTTITNATSNAILLSSSNTIGLDDSTFAGIFGGDGIFIAGANNTLNGAGNTAAGATFPAGNLCEDNGNAWTGTVIFDGVAITSANCP
jgi:hypothetical protein